jgi:hypothetical protein
MSNDTGGDTTPGQKDRFGGKLFLVLLDNKFAPSTRAGRSLWALSETLDYTPGTGDNVITVPKGCVTDLASIPRWAWVLLPPDGPWVKAAIVHDYLYATGGTGKWKKHPTSIHPPRTYERAEADEILREAMENRRVGWFKRTIIYLAVRIGGGPGWRQREQKGPSQQQVLQYIADPHSDPNP